MKKLIALVLFAVSCGAFAAGVALELDGRHSKIKLNDPVGLAFQHAQNKKPDRIYYLEAFSKEEAPMEWKQYEISFTPDKTGSITLGMSASYTKLKGKQVDWIEYDKIEVVNATLYNTSFEEFSYKDEFYRWRYYTKSSEMRNKSDAPDGKNYLRVGRALPARQGLLVTAGKRVTMKFMARGAGITERPAGTFYSDQNAPKAKPQKATVKSNVPAVKEPQNSSMLQFRVAFRGEPFYNVQMSNFSSSANTAFGPTTINGKITPYHVYAFNKTPLTDKWEKFSVTFTPNLTGEINMYVEGVRLAGKPGAWIFFDNFEAKGTRILNPSFENIQAKSFTRWQGNPGNVRQDVEGAPHGKCVAAVCYENVMRQVISVVKNRPVTISFYAKKGDDAKVVNYYLSNKKVPNNFPAKYYRFYDKKIAKYLPLSNKGVPGDAIVTTYPWIELKTPPAVTIQYPVNVRKGNLKKGNIPFELLEENGIARTVDVKFGVPFKRGDIYGLENLAVLSPAGNAVPAQFTAISFWPDKSIKFVLTEFRADLKAKEKSRWNIAVNSGKTAPALPELKCLMTADGFEINTGRLEAVISKSRFNFLRNIKVDGKVAGAFDAAGLTVTGEDKKVYTSSAVPLKKLYIESNGPLAVTLRGEGEFENDMGRFTCRMTFRAGSPVVDFSIRYQNINLKTEFNDIRSLKFTFAPKGKIKTLRMEGTNCRRIFQHNDQKLQVDGRFFNRMMSDGGSAGNITYALKDTAERYPKAFSVSGGKLNFELLPEQPNAYFGKELPFYLNFHLCGGLYRMKWGMGFTEDIKIDFSGKTSPQTLAALDIVPVIDTAYLYKTKVFSGIPNGKNNPFAGIDAQAVDAFYRHMKIKAKQREYGFFNWGDWYGERGRNWTNNEYDLAHGLFMLFLRTGNRDAFRWAMTAARHQADVDIIHAYPDPLFVGANAQHSIGHTGQANGGAPAVWSQAYASGPTCGWNGHTWSEGMTEAWLLGGDVISMEAALMLGEHLVTYIAPQLRRLSTHERSAGWSIPALLGVYRATGNRRYLNAAKLLVDLVLDEQKFELGGAWPHKLPGDHANGHKDTYGNCPYLVGIVLHALQKYNEEMPGKDVQKSIVAAANWLYRGMDKNRIAWPYGMNYDGKHFRLPTQGLNLIIAPGMMTGGRISNDRKIYDASLLITSCTVMTGISHVGKDLAIRLCMLPVLFEEMNRFSARNPKAGQYRFMPEALTQQLGKKNSDRFRMRGPDNMAFEVVAKKPAEITITRYPDGSNPKTKPEFTFKVVDKSGKTVFSGKGKIREKGSWKTKLPAAGKYMVEISDSCTGVWDVLANKDCRIRTELRKGYLFVNGAVSSQYLMIPAGTKEFTIEFFGTHQGGCNLFLLDPQGKLAGSGSVVTAGTPRLPWFKGAETLPKGKIHVKIAKPYKKETAWKFVVFTGGGVRIDLIGAKGQISLTER